MAQKEIIADSEEEAEKMAQEFMDTELKGKSITRKKEVGDKCKIIIVY